MNATQRRGPRTVLTWVRGDLKIQLLRAFEPFPKGATRGLPVNNMLGELGNRRVLVSFDHEPERGRFWAASPGALVALKESAFGRTRHSGEPVDRDYSDAVLSIDRLGREIADEVREAEDAVRRAWRRLLRQLGEPGDGSGE